MAPVDRKLFTEIEDASKCPLYLNDPLADGRLASKPLLEVLCTRDMICVRVCLEKVVNTKLLSFGERGYATERECRRLRRRRIVVEHGVNDHRIACLLVEHNKGQREGSGIVELLDTHQWLLVVRPRMGLLPVRATVGQNGFAACPDLHRRFDTRLHFWRDLFGANALAYEKGPLEGVASTAACRAGLDVFLHRRAVALTKIPFELFRPKGDDIRTPARRFDKRRLKKRFHGDTKGLARAVKATLQRIHRDPERLRCLRCGESFDVAKHDRLPVLLGERIESIREGQRKLLILGLAFWGACRRRLLL